MDGAGVAAGDGVEAGCGFEDAAGEEVGDCTVVVLVDDVVTVGVGGSGCSQQ